MVYLFINYEKPVVSLIERMNFNGSILRIMLD